MNLKWLLPFGLPGMLMASGNLSYMARMNHSIWEHIDSATKCELMHPIPEYGTARFIQAAGKELSFHINTHHPPHEEGGAILRETSPPWIHQPSENRLLHVYVISQDPPFRLKHRESMWLLNSLERGRTGRFEYRDWEEAKYRVQVSLSPVNFHSAFRYFQKCRSGLLDYGFDEIRKSEVNFDTDKFELDEIALRRLDRVARYVTSDPKLHRILIRGHTDSVASDQYNLGLSAKRAHSVSKFFISRGIDNKRLSISYYGEFRPKTDNSTKQGRAENRRVEVEVYR